MIEEINNDEIFYNCKLCNGNKTCVIKISGTDLSYDVIYPKCRGLGKINFIENTFVNKSIDIRDVIIIREIKSSVISNKIKIGFKKSYEM